MLTSTLPIGNTVRIWLRSLFRRASGLYVADATVVMSLLDRDGTVVTGASGLSLAYEEQTQGDYWGLLPASLTLVAGRPYTLVLTATEGTDVLVVRRPLVAAYRT